MRRRNPTPRAGSSPSDRSELEGFLEGLRHRVEERARSGPADPELGSWLTEAQSKIRARDLPGAETLLLRVADRLDAVEDEPELLQYPRGLVEYDAGADRGTPTPESEEPVLNRLRVVDRLVGVGASEGIEVEDLRRRLLEARREYDRGDRKRAERTGNGILDELDRRRAAKRSP